MSDKTEKQRMAVLRLDLRGTTALIKEYDKRSKTKGPREVAGGRVSEAIVATIPYDEIKERVAKAIIVIKEGVPVDPIIAIMKEKLAESMVQLEEVEDLKRKVEEANDPIVKEMVVILEGLSPIEDDATLVDKLNGLISDNTALEDDIADLREKKNELEVTIKEKDGEIESLNSIIVARDKVIETMGSSGVDEAVQKEDLPPEKQRKEQSKAPAAKKPGDTKKKE